MRTRLNNFFKKIMLWWVLRSYPFVVTTKVNMFKTIYVKKGKIREWRTYNADGVRVELIL